MLVNLSFDGFACPAIEIEESASVLQLKQTIELQTAIQIDEQELWAHNRILTSDGATLKEAGVKDNDVVHVRERSKTDASQEEQRVLDHLNSNPQMLQGLPPHLRPRIQTRDRTVVAEVIQFIQAQEAAKRYEEIDALNADEFDPEAQARIAERIRQENIETNMSAAYEHSPESFGEVKMLYVNLEVNGKPLKSFVDSGAQVCVMSMKCAEECNIRHLIDTRFTGMLQGVGEQKMCGRIHSVMVKVATEIVPMSVTVIQHSDVDLLFGLDMLRRYRCCIDLEKNCLNFSTLNVSLPFLPDHEIPSKKPHASAAAAGGPAAGGEPVPFNAPGPSNSAPTVPPAASTAPINTRPKEKAATLPESGEKQPEISPPDTKQSGAQGESDASKISQLTALGFPQQMAEEALKMCGGNVEHAASILFSQ